VIKKTLSEKLLSSFFALLLSTITAAIAAGVLFLIFSLAAEDTDEKIDAFFWVFYYSFSLIGLINLLIIMPSRYILELAKINNYILSTFIVTLICCFAIFLFLDWTKLLGPHILLIAVFTGFISSSVYWVIRRPDLDYKANN
jgi:hypothetical protein